VTPFASIRASFAASAAVRLGQLAISGSPARPISGVHNIGRAADARTTGLR
jgi:hypothetical protein